MDWSNFMSKLPEEDWINEFRLNKLQFMQLVNIFKKDMQKDDTNYRKAIKAELRIANAVHYLTQRTSIRNTANFFRAPYGSVSKAYQELVHLLNSPAFLDKYVVFPTG